MATAKLTKSIAAKSYGGTFNYNVDSATKVSGNIELASDGVTITSVNGSVTKGGEQIADFNAFMRGDKLAYNIGGCEATNFAPVIKAVEEAVDALNASLAPAATA